MDIVTIAETYSLVDLRKNVYRFVSENLSSLSRSPEFHRLSPGQLEHLLDCDFPVNVPEERLLEILLNWLDVDGASRIAHAHRSGETDKPHEKCCTFFANGFIVFFFSFSDS